MFVMAIQRILKNPHGHWNQRLDQALTSLGVDAPELYRAISDKAMQCLQAMSVRLLPVDTVDMTWI